MTALPEAPNTREPRALLPPDAQPVAPRLARLGSLRRELEALLGAAPPEASPEVLRSLVLEANVVSKRTASSRLWTWKSIKLRYVLDPAIVEYRAFVAGMRSTQDPRDRGLLCLLMFARADRLFREVALECVSPHLAREGTIVEPAPIKAGIEARAEHAGLHWAQSTVEAMAVRLLSSLKDFGVLRGFRTRRIIRPQPGPQVALFGARLARLEGLTDRQALEARWFRLLGLDREEVVDLLYSAARSGALVFRMQADVVELKLPQVEGV